MATISRSPATVEGNVEDSHLLLKFLCTMIAMFSSVASIVLSSYHTSYVSMLRSVLWPLGLHFFPLWCIYCFLCYLETWDREFLHFCILSLVPVVAGLAPHYNYSSDSCIVLVATSGLFIFLWHRMPSRVWVGLISVIISALILLFEGVASFFPVVLAILWFKFKSLTRPPSEDTGSRGGSPGPVAKMETADGPSSSSGIDIRGAERDNSSSRASQLAWLLVFAHVAHTMNQNKNVGNASTLKSVDTRALNQMGDRDLKELGVPTVRALPKMKCSSNMDKYNFSGTEEEEKILRGMLPLPRRPTT